MKVQEEFVQSLQNLSSTFGFTPSDEMNLLPYPLNIGYVLNKTRQQIKQVLPDAKLILVQSVEKALTLATIKEREAEYGLYYLPVRPFFYLLRDRRNQRRTQLISCIYAYLYRVAKIPYCANDRSTFISSEYDYILEREFEMGEEELAEEDIEKGETARYIKQIDSALIRCRRRFDQQRQLDSFADTLDRFHSKTDADCELVKVAQRLLELYETYPTYSFEQAMLFDHEQENEYGEMPIHIDRRVSFIWSDDDVIYQYLMENFDAEFSAGSTEAPYTCSVLFDKLYANTSELEKAEEYMVHLLDCMADFINYMCKLDDEQRKQRVPSVLPA